MSPRKITMILLFLLTLSLDADSLKNHQNGSLLFYGNCVTCHLQNKAVSAPSVAEIKQKYISAFAKKEDFVEYMSAWVHKPKEETSIMLESVNKYGLMPELGFEMDALRAISAYIYESDFSKIPED